MRLKSGRNARPACTRDKASTAWALCGMLATIVTKGKPRKKAVLARVKTWLANAREMGNAANP